MQERTVIVNGMRVHYIHAGNGPALLLVHGLVGSARNWEPNIEALAHVRTVYAIDLANMGASERVHGLDPGLEAAADRLSAFLRALAIDAADVAGHSHGGAICMMLAARHPRQVRKLILFAPANPYCEMGRGLIAFYNSRLGTLVARAIPWMPRRVHDIAHRRMYGDPAQASPAALEGYTQGLNPASIRHILGIVGQWWTDMALLETRLTELAGRPVLLIWGDRDGAVSLSSGYRLAATLGAKLLVLPGVGHLPFAERPEHCNEAMRDFLQS